MHNFNLNTKNDGQWLTPPELVKSLGHFDLDPCQPIEPPFTHADVGFNEIDDGLEQLWFGRVWLNPPYGTQTKKWLNRAHEYGDVIALIFARTETNWFHEYVWNKADAIYFIKGRINFHYVCGKRGDRANAPSCLVAYGKNNINALKNCCYEGKLVLL